MSAVLRHVCGMSAALNRNTCKHLYSTACAISIEYLLCRKRPCGTCHSCRNRFQRALKRMSRTPALMAVEVGLTGAARRVAHLRVDIACMGIAWA